jgi:hypothetical protein
MFNKEFNKMGKITNKTPLIKLQTIKTNRVINFTPHKIFSLILTTFLKSLFGNLKVKASQSGSKRSFAKLLNIYCPFKGDWDVMKIKTIEKENL